MRILQSALDEVNKITSSLDASETNRILEDNYSPCLFEHIDLEKRITILNNLFSGDDRHWEFSNSITLGDRFFLDELILSTPEKDRIALLKKGFMANQYHWLSRLWNKSKGFWNNDVTISNILPLVNELGHWVQLYYKDLNVPVTTAKIDRTGIPGFEEFEYPVAFATPVCIGVKGDSKDYFYIDLADNGFLYSLKKESDGIIFKNGTITFQQRFLGDLFGQYLSLPGSSLPEIHYFSNTLQVSPFEPVVVISSRDYSALGIEKGNKYVIPAFLAAVYQQSLDDNASWDKVRSAGNYVAIGAAVIAAPFTEGASWAAYTAVAAGIIAAADEVVKPGRLKLGSSDAYDEKYKAFYQAWDVLYTATMGVDALANATQLVRSLRSIRIALSAKKLFSAAKSCGKQADVLALWGKGADEAVQLGKYSLASISKERGFVDMLPELLKKEGITEEEFVNYTNYVRKELPDSPRAQIARLRNAVPSPTAETVMQKVIPASDLENYISGDYSSIRGFLTRAVDTKHLRSYDDLYWGLRLDYKQTEFSLDDGYCYIIRFKSPEVPLKVETPRGYRFKYLYPFTSHGFTAGTKGRIGVPEFKTIEDITMEAGTEIWRISRDGEQTLFAVFDSLKFKKIK